MTMNNPYEQYQHNSIFTATPEELTLMLYNGIIKFLNQAKIQIKEKSIEGVHNNVVKAQNIITELSSTLDIEYEVSQNLSSLYYFMNSNLIQANLHKFDGGSEKIDQVLLLVKDLRDTWQEAMKIAKLQRKSG